MARPVARLAQLVHAVPKPLLGLSLMLLAAFLNSLMAAVIKQVVHELPVFETVFLRHLMGVLLMLPLYLRSGKAAMRTSRIGLHALRSVLNVVAILCYFSALGLTTLVEVTALNFTAPLFASVLAVIILGEPMRAARWTGLVLGFGGALIILRPGFHEVGLGAVLVLVSSVMWAGALICIKLVSRTDSALTITFLAALMQMPITFVLALFVWQWPTLEQIGLIAVISVFGTVSQIALSQAFREADATVVLPGDFTKLIWTGLIGYFLFAELPDLATWIGALIVCAGVFWIAYKERRPMRAAPAGAPGLDSASTAAPRRID